MKWWLTNHPQYFASTHQRITGIPPPAPGILLLQSFCQWNLLENNMNLSEKFINSIRVNDWKPNPYNFPCLCMTINSCPGYHAQNTSHFRNEMILGSPVSLRLLDVFPISRERLAPIVGQSQPLTFGSLCPFVDEASPILIKFPA